MTQLRDVLKPRQVVLETCTLIIMSRPGTPMIDLRGAVREINVYESILSSVITGTIVLDDITGMIEGGPIIGEEAIALKFRRSTDQTYEGIFRVTKLTDVEFPRDEMQQYQLHFVSPEMLTNLGHRVCRAFKNMTASDAVAEVLKKDLQTAKTQHIDSTKPPMTVTIPTYTPFETIQFFTQRALTVSTPAQANFFFWETLDGFRFQAMSTLMTANTVAIIQRSPANLPGSFAENIINPERIQIPQAFDVLEDMDQGLFASRIIAVDLIRQDYQIIDNHYRTDFQKRTHLDPYPAYTRSHTETANTSARISVVSATNSLSANTPSITALDPSIRSALWPEVLATRTTQMNELQRHSTLVEGPGNALVRAGSVVEMRIPSNRLQAAHPATPGEVVAVHWDRFHSGRHLVLACRHQIKNTDGKFQYYQSLELVKDSLAASLT